MNRLRKYLFGLLLAAIGSYNSGCGSCNSTSPPDTDDPGNTASTVCTMDNANGDKAVALSAQQTDWWCWTACGEMSMESLGTPVEQCDEANKYFGRTDCCNSPTPDSCINGGWPPFDKYGFSADRTTDKELTFEEIKRQIFCLHSPVVFTWHWTGGGGHMMVITGYTVIDGEEYLKVNDPGPAFSGEERIISYSEYVSSSSHTHWDDFYNIRKL